MRGIPSSILFLFFVLVFLIELISYFGFRALIRNLFLKWKGFLSAFYILIGISATGLLLYAFFNPEFIRQSKNYNFFYFVISVTFLNLAPKSVFAFFTLFSLLIKRLAYQSCQLISLAGASVLSVGIFLTLLYGITVGRYDVRLVEQNLNFPDLPAQLDGLKIVQISDIHLGSFRQNTQTLETVLNMIDGLSPDLLLFTGDMVNNFSNEFEGFEPYLKRLSAKYGKFAIQGNHDYGDYYNWPDSVSKRKNLRQIENGVRNAGFELLLNQWKQISVKDSSLTLIGVENWGHKPFPQYANLDIAMKGVPQNSFKILMTHDPAHWTSIVAPQTDIPLTLSGHTHGGQFGVRIAGIEFSPMYIISKTWGGLYLSDDQYLYVNRGLGTIGFMGRVEMRPEITLLTLHRAKNH
jgi:predicted MPP superfamily phosphohydrolase